MPIRVLLNPSRSEGFVAFMAAAKGALSGLEQIRNAVGTIADVLAYFDSNYQVSGREMDVANQALFLYGG